MPFGIAWADTPFVGCPSRRLSFFFPSKNVYSSFLSSSDAVVRFLSILFFPKDKPQQTSRPIIIHQSFFFFLIIFLSIHFHCSSCQFVDFSSSERKWMMMSSGVFFWNCRDACLCLILIAMRLIVGEIGCFFCSMFDRPSESFIHF